MTLSTQHPLSVGGSLSLSSFLLPLLSLSLSLYQESSCLYATPTVSFFHSNSFSVCFEVSMVKKGGGGASLRQSSDRRCSLSVTVTKLPRVGDVFVVHFFFFFFWKVFRPLWNSWSLWDKLVRYISKTIDTFNNCGFFGI